MTIKQVSNRTPNPGTNNPSTEAMITSSTPIPPPPNTHSSTTKTKQTTPRHQTLACSTDKPQQQDTPRRHLLATPQTANTTRPETQHTTPVNSQQQPMPRRHLLQTPSTDTTPYHNSDALQPTSTKAKKRQRLNNQNLDHPPPIPQLPSLSSLNPQNPSVSNLILFRHNSPPLYIQGSQHILSNFHPTNFSFQGKSYPSLEHCWQSLKVTYLGEKHLLHTIANTTKAGAAKAATSPLHKRFYPSPDSLSDPSAHAWLQYRLPLMRILLQHRADQDPAFQNALLNSGFSRLSHTVPDAFWGTGSFLQSTNFMGSNHFGTLLMELRSGLASNLSTILSSPFQQDPQIRTPQGITPLSAIPSTSTNPNATRPQHSPPMSPPTPLLSLDLDKTFGHPYNPNHTLSRNLSPTQLLPLTHKDTTMTPPSLFSLDPLPTLTVNTSRHTPTQHSPTVAFPTPLLSLNLRLPYSNTTKPNHTSTHKHAPTPLLPPIHANNASPLPSLSPQDPFPSIQSPTNKGSTHIQPLQQTLSHNDVSTRPIHAMSPSPPPNQAQSTTKPKLPKGPISGRDPSTRRRANLNTTETPMTFPTTYTHPTVLIMDSNGARLAPSIQHDPIHLIYKTGANFKKVQTALSTSPIHHNITAVISYIGVNDRHCDPDKTSKKAFRKYLSKLHVVFPNARLLFPLLHISVSGTDVNPVHVSNLLHLQNHITSYTQENKLYNGTSIVCVPDDIQPISFDFRGIHISPTALFKLYTFWCAHLPITHT